MYYFQFISITYNAAFHVGETDLQNVNIGDHEAEKEILNQVDTEGVDQEKENIAGRRDQEVENVDRDQERSVREAEIGDQGVETGGPIAGKEDGI